jgi:hypothetical protein
VSYTVTFKHEDTVNGRPVGPVTVIDHDEYDQDPEIAEGGIGIPFGYKPRGVTDLGWQTRSAARQIAAGYGVPLTED